MPASIAAGASVTIPVSFFNNNTAGRYLKGWIDFNNDGVFNDVDVATLGGERISNLLTNANAAQQSVNVNFTVPVAASVGSARGVRFRISDNVATTPVSSGAAGETEDYV
ncbi:MAG: GEVED domain-containing protein, partial [bacterium]